MPGWYTVPEPEGHMLEKTKKEREREKGRERGRKKVTAWWEKLMEREGIRK